MFTLQSLKVSHHPAPEFGRSHIIVDETVVFLSAQRAAFLVDIAALFGFALKLYYAVTQVIDPDPVFLALSHPKILFIKARVIYIIKIKTSNMILRVFIRIRVFLHDLLQTMAEAQVLIVIHIVFQFMPEDITVFDRFSRIALYTIIPL